MNEVKFFVESHLHHYSEWKKHHRSFSTLIEAKAYALGRMDRSNITQSHLHFEPFAECNYRIRREETIASAKVSYHDLKE